MAGKTRHLLHRSGRYFARMAVPESLRPIIGKRELLEALGADRTLALRAHPAAVAAMQATLDAARAQASTGQVARLPTRNRPLYPAQLARAHYDAELRLDEAARAGGDIATLDFDPREFNSSFAPAYRGLLKKVAAGYATDDEIGAAIGWAIDAFAKRGNTDVRPATPEWRSLARTLAGVQLEAMDRRGERDEGDYSGKPRHPALSGQATPEGKDAQAVRVMSSDSHKPLSELLPEFLKQRGAKPSTNYEYEVVVRMFEEALGDAKPAYKITRADVHGFKRLLSEAPSNYAKRFPKLTIRQAIEANGKQKEPFAVISARTVNDKYLSGLHSILNWCVRSDILPDNPAANIKVDVVKGNKPPPRVHFSPDDLARIFAPPAFTPGKPIKEEQWAPLIALFTGARPSELAQIKLDSVRHERGILCMAIEEETKNRGSQRLVPIHSTLVALGLAERIEALRKAGETHLFPGWYRQGMEAKARFDRGDGKATLNNYFTRFITKRFNVTYLPKIGINDPRKNFYSFRHTFKTGLSRAGVDRATRDYICGHSDSSAGAVYVHDISVDAMKQAIEKLKFDGFTFGVLKGQLQEK